MSNIDWNEDAVGPGIQAGRDTIQMLTGNPDAPNGPTDPDIDGILDERDQGTHDQMNDGDKVGDGVQKTAEELAEEEERKKREAEGIDTDTSQDGSGGKDGLGGDPGKDNKLSDKNQLNANVPSNQTAQQQPSMPQMPSGSSMPSAGMPSLPQMTQSDMAAAPNRDQLMSQLQKDGPGERSKFDGEMSDDENERRVQELAKKIVDMDMPYTWGGGHGAEPGPSGGIRDGGVADRFGDYAKTGVDCSGLSRWMTYQLYGVDPNGTSQSQYASGQPVSAANARPGDMFFPDSAGRPPTHVQVYVGNGQVVEAQKSGTNIMFSPLKSGEFRRFA